MNGGNRIKMKAELENDLRQITQVIYCDMGEKKIKQLIELIEPFCMGKESKEILKVIKNEKKLIDKRFEKVYEYNKGYFVSKEELRKAMEKI